MFIPHTKQDIARMLERIGASSVDDLYRRATGLDAVSPPAPDLPPAMDMVRLGRHLAQLSSKNLRAAACFCGGGAYRHWVHPAVDQLIARTEFLTAYTPYQAEASQGTLQAVFEFQTMAASLLGTEVANASMYDGASATAEAALMACRIKGRGTVVLSEALHPEFRRVVRSYLHAFEGKVVDVPWDAASGATSLSALDGAMGEDVAAVILGYPNVFGVIEDIEAAARLAHRADALLVSSTAEGVALGLLEAPGAMGADIAVCEGLSLGLPMSFGGPGVGLFGCGTACVKQMPGRLVGKTVDADGKDAYVLTLAMREQHIRRERATSNICTNHSLCALAVTIHLSLLGPEGFRKQAEINAHRARSLVRKLQGTGVLEPVFSGPWFNETVMRVKGIRPDVLIDRMAARNILIGPALGRWYGNLADGILVSATECVDETDMDELCSAISGIRP